MVDEIEFFVEVEVGLVTAVVLLIKTVVALTVSSGHLSPIKMKVDEQIQAKCDVFLVESKTTVSLHVAVCGPQIPFRLHIPINKNK
jgi:hypothetical protein